MIGYDAGARLGLDENSSGPFGEIWAGSLPIPEILQSADVIMGAIPEIVVKNAGNAAEPDTVITAAADMTARMHGGAGGSHGSDICEASLDKNSFDAQQALVGYYGNSARALFYKAEAVPFYHNYGVMADDGLTTPDRIGGANLPSRSIGIQQSRLENDGGLSVAYLAAVAAENDQRYHGMPEIPGLAGNPRDEYGDPQAPDGVESGHGVDFIPRAVEKLRSRDNRISNGSASSDHLGKLDDLYTRIIASGNMNDGQTYNPTAETNSNSHVFDEAATELSTEFGNKLGVQGFGVGQVSPESKDKILSDRVDDVIAELLAKGSSRNEASKGHVPGNIEGASADFDGRLDELAGIGVIGKHIWPSVQDAEIGKSTSSQFPGDAMNPSTSLGAFASPDQMSRDEGRTDLAGLWDMFRNAERFLPKQGNAGRGGGKEVAAEVSEGAETGSITLPAKALASNLDDFCQQPSDMAAGHTTPFGGRSGPSGHKNDPIYTVAISQATGMLMPMVPTSGTSTRSPPIPGQRNLP